MNALESPAPAEISRLEENLAGVQAEIRAACARAGRDPGTVELLAVVKSVDPPVVRLLARRGVLDVGESTVQGANRKSSRLADLPALRWHLVGHLQRNKARKAVQLFSAIHSLDSQRLARKLEEEIADLEGGAAGEPRPRIYVEVNIAREPQKSGVEPEGVAELLAALRGLPRVARRVAGLMAIAPQCGDPQAARPHFRRLREVRDRLRGSGLLPPDAGLSMGMSADYTVAVEEGATLVRVGTRLFEGLGILPGEAPRCP